MSEAMLELARQAARGFPDVTGAPEPHMIR